jgi:cell division septation protein DedD
MDDGTTPPELRAEARPLPPRFRKSRVWVAGLALAAFAVFSLYAYRQATKTGEQTVAPLIAADEQPTRAKPEEPGGMEIPHQDKSIYERLGTEEPPPKVETLLPPPEAPMPKPAAPEQTAGAPSSPSASTEAPAAVPAPPSPPADGKELAKVAPSAAPAATPPAAPAEAAQSAAPAAPGESAPATPPASTATTTTTTTTAAATTPGAAAPQAAAGGAYRIQLSAVRNEQAAETEWKRLQKSHADLLGSLSLSIVRADLGAKGTFYRVQAGALSETAARDLCAELKRRKAECLVVKP